MSTDRFIDWGEPPEWGRPTIARLATVAQDFLGERWTVRTIDDDWLVCECADRMTFALRSERDDLLKDGPEKGKKTFGQALHEDAQTRTRCFEVFFSGEHGEDQTSVITRHSDEFTGAVADQFARLIARWWNGKVRWPS